MRLRDRNARNCLLRGGAGWILIGACSSDNHEEGSAKRNDLLYEKILRDGDHTASAMETDFGLLQSVIRTSYSGLLARKKAACEAAFSKLDCGRLVPARLASLRSSTLTGSSAVFDHLVERLLGI